MRRVLEFVGWVAFMAGLVYLMMKAHVAVGDETPVAVTSTSSTSLVPLSQSYRIHDALKAWAIAHPGRGPTPEEWKAIVDGAVGQ